MAEGTSSTSSQPPREDVSRIPTQLLYTLGALRRAGGCPDCIADVTIEHSSGGVHVLSIAHDQTCPTYLAMLRRRRTR